MDGVSCPRVALSVEARGLRDLDGSRANPHIVLDELEVSGAYKKLGVTESVERAVDVHFAKQLVAEYAPLLAQCFHACCFSPSGLAPLPRRFHFEQVQTLRFTICCDEPGEPTEVIGVVVCTLSDIITHPERMFQAPIMRDGRQVGVATDVDVVVVVS